MSAGQDTAGPLRVTPRLDGRAWDVALARPKANILDGAMIAALTRTFDQARDTHGLCAIVLHGEGSHFSFGASVEEHLPGPVEDMIPAFGNLFRALLDCPVPVLAAVCGQCLGGGLELVTACTRVFADATARLGQPEIRLGVLAPVASILLPQRVGPGPAADLCLTGRPLGAAEAHAIGLVDELCDDPLARAWTYVEEHLAPLSASSLGLAQRAVRLQQREALDRLLPAAERLYLRDLMATDDALEGLESFVHKRKPQWRHR